MSVVRRISIGAVLPAATLASLVATSPGPDAAPAAERRPTADQRGDNARCGDAWSPAPAITRDVDRLMKEWSGNGSSDARGSGKSGKAATVTSASRKSGSGKSGKSGSGKSGSGKSASGESGLGRTAPVAADPGKSSSQGRPNVIVFMVDDMRADEMSGPWMRQTRGLIQSQGVTFRNSFSPLPVCGPARASFLTGQYAHNTGVRKNMDPKPAADQLDDSDTLPVWLQNSGYNTAFLGKYINGYAMAKESDPGSYVPPGWDNWYGSTGAGTYNYWKTILSDNGNGRINLSGEYQTNAYGRMGSDLVSRLAKKKDPFYFNLSFTAPHTGTPHEDDDPDVDTPARLPKTRGAYDGMITTPSGVSGEPCNDDLPRAVSGRNPISPSKQQDITEARRQRAESLATVDDAVARVMRSLRKSGELDNTYVIFTSDNGYFLGEFRQPVGKKLQYEPSLRTPTIMRGPGIDDGIKRDRPFTTIDFAPTIADMANAKTGAKVDGKSMLDAAKGKPKPWRRPVLTDTGARFGKPHYGMGVRTDGRFYGEYNDPPGSKELFNVFRDPNQNKNLIGQPRYRAETRRMSKLLSRLRSCKGDQCRKPVGWSTSKQPSKADGGGS